MHSITQKSKYGLGCLFALVFGAELLVPRISFADSIFSRPVHLQVLGTITTQSLSSLRRQLDRIRTEKSDLVLIEIDARGSVNESAIAAFNDLRRIQNAKTVAFIRQSAKGSGALLALACDEILIDPIAEVGDLQASLTLPEQDRISLKARLIDAAVDHRRPATIIANLLANDTPVIELIHKKDGSRLFVTRQQLSDLPDRDVWNTQGVLPMVGDHSSLMFTGKQAVQFGIAQGLASDWASVLKRVGISSAVPTWSETWVDHVVVILNHPVSTAVLLGTGLVFLYIELATAGIGLATLPAALCFMLFFWSKILGGTATWLEVLLFLAGVACLIIELLVIPGFGVVGVTGIVLIVASVLMAIQGFLWPQSGAEVQTFGRTIVQLVGGMILFGAGAVTVSRYLQVSPTFRQFILQPSATAVESFNLADNVLNAVGVSVTDLHPSGKIRLGERILDVVADGCFVRAGERVRVMDVEGNRIRVSKV